MSAQSRTEEALRQMHVMLANAEYAPGSHKKVVVDKEATVAILKELGECLYEMLDESELTAASRDRADRSMRAKADLQKENARKQAQDIYAASVMYSDQALTRIQEIVKQAQREMEHISARIQEDMRNELNTIKDNQYELKGQLQDLEDTEKYLKLIREENKRIEKEKLMGQFTMEADRPSYQDVKPEIHVNPAYFAQTDTAIPEGVTVDGEKEQEKEQETQQNAVSDDVMPTEDAILAATMVGEDLEAPLDAKLSADLDADYFAWKEQEEQEEEEKEEGGWLSFFRKK
ncbi:hypothetical protein SAMN05216391_11066 [Lachnospiraceae bacterium KHCPX20]|nr:hypothetical protein SAMN05216391_11066 [Lachnospiraceae bacterium KHCPX20]